MNPNLSKSIRIDPRGFQDDPGTATLPETNIAPENRPSQMETSLPIIHFQGL